ncbi:hypothetical protein [Desulforhabdus sp. TSK]|uniref:hypothetical protein n=1 Tax=Desulforhabdus sp. TSK TaxID=2925014 RepID=UPI001FC88E69|nr:hypothetical protein [Desulforhabdus sp. TSK]GKT10019.1 hypothetical protein DSTSK_33240 [Desulforhabdus sp. TSK]
MTNQEFDERMAAERQLVNDILKPFYGLKYLLDGEMKMVSSADIAVLMGMALERAESLADGGQFIETAAG